MQSVAKEGVTTGDSLAPIASLRWRGIGPYRGGRSVAVAGHPTDPFRFYFGSTGGGVWETTNAGVTWRNITDGFFRSASVGAIAVAPSDPNVLYVGTGEACIRSNVSYGDGVYRSLDGGASWENLGLEATRHIARVRIHPTDPDTVYVAALGHAFGPNPERGVYRTRNGGKNWDLVLSVSSDTGAIDLSMDPLNPRVLYAAMWQGRRKPWRLDSGGPESGLYRSTDGGDTWQPLGPAQGLPGGVVGRIGVAASGAQRGRVWALYEAADGGMFRSDDGGESWERTTTQQGPRSRPYYYTHVFADPFDANTVFVLAARFWKSIDAGKTFEALETPHGDHHDLWLDPTRPGRMIHGADGGATVSFDDGASWSSIHNQATAELYHVTTDTRFPYRVYGAQQDNTTICVPSASHLPALTKSEWYTVGGAESGYIAVRPENPDIVYAGSSGFGEGGRLTRYDHGTKQLRDISVWPQKTSGVAAEEYVYRFQWTSPISLGKHDPRAIFSCANRVFRSIDDGQSWQVMSPDLTRNDPDKLRPTGGPITIDQTGAEIYCTVFAFAESPLAEGLFWAGSDDGLIHVTHDDGATWTNVTPPELPDWSLISIIEPSHFDPDTAYVAANRYKLDDTRPFLLRTRDGGKSWTPITDGLPQDVYTRVIREDPEVKGLLYCGTERGVSVSFDDGEHWQPLRLNLPVVPIHDLEVKGTDLVAATHGRSFWILDDITPVRALAQSKGAGGVRLFPPRDTVRSTAKGGGFDRVPDKVMRPVIVGDHYVARKPETGDAPIYLDAGQNVPPGVILQYYLDVEPQAPVTIRIRDAGGTEAFCRSSDKTGPGEVRPLASTAGSHRLVWDMHYPGAKPAEDAGMRWPDCAPLAPPGAYEVTLEIGSEVVTRHAFRLLPPPGAEVKDQDLAEQFALLCRLRDQVEAVNLAFNRATRLRTRMEDWVARLDDPASEPLRTEAESIAQSLTAIRDSFVQWRADNPQDQLNFPPRLNARLAHVFQVAASADARPTSQTYEALKPLEAETDEALARLDELVSGALARFNGRLRDLALPAVDA